MTCTELRAPFRRGDTLLLYTDGLVERRDEDVDHGLSRLVAGMPLLELGDLEAGPAKVVATDRDHSREDDVAALVAHRLPGSG